MDWTQWIELLFLIVALVADFYAGMQWEAHRTRSRLTGPARKPGQGVAPPIIRREHRQ